MNGVDSPGWLEYIANGPNSGFLGDAIEDIDTLIVPAISLFEVSSGCCVSTARLTRCRLRD